MCKVCSNFYNYKLYTMAQMCMTTMNVLTLQIRNIAINVTYQSSRALADCFWLSWRHQNMWATLITGTTFIEVLSEFFSELQNPASQINSQINDTDWPGLFKSENLRKTCTQISCKVVSVVLSEKLPTSRYVTKCKPERTNCNCDMAY